MKITLIESLGVDENIIKDYQRQLEEMGHEFNYYLDISETNQEQKRRVGDSDIIMIANNPLANEALEDNKNLEYINIAFTGFDHVDIEYMNKRNIKVSNASGYSNTSVKELVMGLVLNIYRMINEGDKQVRKQNTFKQYYTGHEIKGKTVGIIGTGNIGSDVAKLFLAFDANVVAYSNTEKENLKSLGVKYKSLEDLLKESDIVSIHLPLNNITKNTIGKNELKLMKKNSILINCARGPIVDNEALTDALNNDEIAFAGIDVFDYEPPLNKDYPLLNAKNTLLQPHIAYLTKESLERRAHIVFDTLISYLNGEAKNIVNN